MGKTPGNQVGESNAGGSVPPGASPFSQYEACFRVYRRQISSPLTSFWIESRRWLPEHKLSVASLITFYRTKSIKIKNVYAPPAL
jgi:hypothetical protein